MEAAEITLAHLQKYVAHAVGVDVGWYSHTSVSAHMYHVRDAEELGKFVTGLSLERDFDRLSREGLL